MLWKGRELWNLMRVAGAGQYKYKFRRLDATSNCRASKKGCGQRQYEQDPLHGPEGDLGPGPGLGGAPALGPGVAGGLLVAQAGRGAWRDRLTGSRRTLNGRLAAA
ncbi:hypothetical protein TgHK011_001960 [Trichoderma gracile]|nr:hypothetical protein TgHK011_001960 [Trichoderma gracile]